MQPGKHEGKAYKLKYYLFLLTPLLIAAPTPSEHAPGGAPLRDLGFFSGPNHPNPCQLSVSGLCRHSQ